MPGQGSPGVEAARRMAAISAAVGAVALPTAAAGMAKVGVRVG